MSAGPILTVLLSWRDAKLFFKHSIAFSTDSVHVIASVVIMIAAALWLRKPLSGRAPWLVVLALACLNEVVDLYLYQWPDSVRQYAESVKDLLLTMVLPTLLLLTFRYYPSLARSPDQADAQSPSADGDQPS